MADSTATLTLYTTAGCHLCEQARLLIDKELAQEGDGDARRWQLVLCDIADDEALVQRYGIRIPVLRRADNGEELGWPFDARMLAAFLAGQ